jgi:outer membrane protein OmpA-like peptidoglycan-associated protein
MRRLAMLLLLVSAMISGAPMPGAQAADPPGRKFVVFFQEWSVAIDDAAAAVIMEASHLALEHPRATVQVTGFADPEGGRKSNLLLSELRAQRVVDHLLAGGVPAGQIRQIGKGSVKFAISALESRRVEILIPTK